MRYRGHKIEIVEQGTKAGEYWRCQVAVDGSLAIPFDVHEADFLNFATPTLRNAFLARQGMSLLETYGDARWPFQRPVADSLPAA